MFNKLRNWIILFAGSLMLLLGVVSVQSAGASAASNALQSGACGASSINAADCNTQAPKTVNSLNGTIKNAINIFSIIAGVVAVLMIVAAGFRYITSAGAEQAVAGAKRTLLYAVIGLVIVAFAQVIAKFTLHEATQTTSTSKKATPGSGGINPVPGGPH